MSRPDWWNQSDQRHGYDIIIASLGHTVVAQEWFGDYQGDIGCVLRDADGRIGTLVIGYGSCSGCDALEAERPWGCYGDDHGADCDCDWSDVVTLRDQIAADIQWNKAPAPRDENDWWTFDKPLMEWLVAEYARAATP